MSVFRAYARAFEGLPRPVWLLALVIFVNRAGTMVLPFLALWVTNERGLSASHAGTLLGVYGGGAIAGTWLGGVLTDRVGARTVQLWSLLLSAFGFLGLLAAPSWPWMLVAIAGLSLASEAFRPANATAVAAAVTPEQRPRAMALNRLAVNVGMAMGPAIGGQLARYSYDLLFWVDAVTCVLSGLLLSRVLDRDPPRPPPDPAAPPADSPYRDRVFLTAMALMLVMGVVFFQFLGALPLYLHDIYGMGEGAIGSIFAINGVVIVVFEMLLITRIQRMSPLRAMALGGVATSVGFGLTGFGDTLPFAALTVVIWTVGEMMSAPMSAAFAANRSDRSPGAYLGVYNMAFGAAFVLAPIVGTRLYEAAPHLTWPVIGALGLCASAGLWALHQREAGARPIPHGSNLERP